MAVSAVLGATAGIAGYFAWEWRDVLGSTEAKWLTVGTLLGGVSGACVASTFDAGLTRLAGALRHRTDQELRAQSDAH